MDRWLLLLLAPWGTLSPTQRVWGEFLLLPRDKISDPATIGRRSGPGEVVTWERGSAWGEQLRAVYPPSVKDDGGLSTLRPWFIKGKRKVTLLRKIRVTLICFTSF